MKMIVKIQQSERGAYRAQVPALPGCVANGRTVQEAMRNIEQAVRGYLASLGACIPERIQPRVVGA